MTIKVKKRTFKNNAPRYETYNPEKVHKVLFWAAEGYENKVSPSDVEVNSRLKIYDGISTEEIHESLIRTAADMIKEEVAYQYMAAKLYLFHLRKKVFGQYEPPKIYPYVEKMVNEGYYTKEILEKYSKSEIEEMDKIIDHKRDLKFTHVGITKFSEKYLIRNRVTGEIFETPQFAYIMIAATLFMNENKKDRMKYIKDFYDASSLHILSLPTPIIAGARTKTKQFSSCVLIDMDDTRKSITSGATGIVEYVSLKAGIGGNIGRNRGVGMPIKNGEARHTGIIPFLKFFYGALSSCSQGGLRKGSATFYYPFWHQEFENAIVLKNNTGTEETRIRHMDYGVQFNKLFFERLINNDNVTLFSPMDTPGLYDAFFQDQKKFKELYEKYEKDETITKKKVVSAFSIASKFLIERANTGRIYYMASDHSNDHSSFIKEIAPVYMSNLCAEITLPTKPLLKTVDDKEGEIALCTLMALNLGKIDTNNYNDYYKYLYIAVRALDNLLDYQEYPVEAAGYHAIRRRSLGIGITNFAYFLAKNNVKYSDGSANEIVHEMFEKFQYALLESSMNLAKERGECEYFSQTKYSKGILPIDTYRKSVVDQICAPDYKMDWEKLRGQIVQNGLRHSTLSALMPCETSSQVLNATNGFEPPKNLISIKGTTESASYQVVDEYEKYKDFYETTWKMKSNIGYLNLAAIGTKFIDQSISANTYYDPYMYPKTKIPLSILLRDFIHSWNIGLKTLYYQVTREDEGDEDEEVLNYVEEDCDSCKL